MWFCKIDVCINRNPSEINKEKYCNKIFGYMLGNMVKPDEKQSKGNQFIKREINSFGYELLLFVQPESTSLGKFSSWNNYDSKSFYLDNAKNVWTDYNNHLIKD